MWRAILSSIVFIAAQCVQRDAAAQPVLVPGATPMDCRSVLQIGVATCGEGSTANPDRAQSITEAQVSEYLAQYGKPPREAVRALLEPSDKNIAAWVRQQRQVVSIASYVAARMTQMQSQLEADSASAPWVPVSQLPTMFQMRATLFLNSEGASSLRSVRALEQVAGRYPSVDGRVVRTGPVSGTELTVWLSKLGTVLPVSIATPDAMNGYSVPSLLIEDLRYGTSQRLDATELTAQSICDQIVALRSAAESAETRSRPQ
jgi:hypothetical protein